MSFISRGSPKESFLLVLFLISISIYYWNSKSSHFGISSNPKTKTNSNDFRHEDIIRMEMLERQLVMRNACVKHQLDIYDLNDSLHQPNPWEFLISKPFHLIWCNVFKSGSSSWMYIFNRLGGYTDNYLEHVKSIPPLNLARQKYPRPSKEDLLAFLNDSISFIIGRHPFERLVSGYRDKILRAFHGSYHDDMKKKILRKYRRLSSQQSEFERVQPTFPEFVRYILEEPISLIDMHWAPVYSFCNPCQINFTFIAKFETFDRDTNYIIDTAKLRQILGYNLQIHRNEAKGGKSTKDYVTNYLAELNSELYANLSNFYRIDFDIFGYNIPSYQQLHF